MARGCILMAEYVVIDKEQLEADLTVVADAIRKKGGTTEKLEFPQGMKEAVNNIETGITPTGTIEITENGMYDVTNYANAEVNVIGEELIYHAMSIQFSDFNAFGKSEVTITLNKPRNLASAFSQNFVKNTTLQSLTLNVNQAPANMNAIFYCLSAYKDEFLKKIVFNVDTNNVTAFASAFMNLTALEELQGIPLDLTNMANVNGMFASCSALKEVRFKENSINQSFSINNSGLLSSDSIQSIIDGLSDLTGGTGQTLTLHADVKAKLTEEQITAITSKNWTLA